MILNPNFHQNTYLDTHQARLKVNGQTLLTLQEGDHPDEWNESHYTFTDHLGTGTITMGRIKVHHLPIICVAKCPIG